MVFLHRRLPCLIVVATRLPTAFTGSLPVRTARRFARQQDGAAAVEFALVAAPFSALIFAILETALVFFAGQTLETAASASRPADHDRPGADAGLQPDRLQDQGGLRASGRRAVRLHERRLCRRQELYQLHFGQQLGAGRLWRSVRHHENELYPRRPRLHRDGDALLSVADLRVRCSATSFPI